MPLDNPPSASAQTSPRGPKNVQAQLVMPARSPVPGRAELARRDWSLYCFFRIVPDAELKATNDALLKSLGGEAAQAPLASLGRYARGEYTDIGDNPSWPRLALSLAQPPRPKPHLSTADELAAGRAGRFRQWLNLLVNEEPDAAAAEATRIAAQLLSVAAEPRIDGAGASAEPPAWAFAELAERLELPGMWRPETGVVGWVFAELAQRLRLTSMWRPAANVEGREETEGLLNRAGLELFGAEDELESPLLRLIAYELLRHVWAAASGKEAPSLLRPQAEESAPQAEGEFDRSPITLAFTYSGLEALQLDPRTLDSFPDPFKQGMAARAHRLCDTGAGAPENWENVLGLNSVHGYFTGGSNLHGQTPSKDEFWKTLRREIRTFNDPSDDLGAGLRTRIGLMSRIAGVEILHIELGQRPYEVAEDGSTKRLDENYEHFGFRDGLSQPLVDLGLGSAAPGGGTPAPGRHWTPVAGGEIFLDEVDEDGATHQAPNNKILREDSTYIVFRKLEQDVEGFRTFLETRRPGDPGAQERLAAQFVGRWKDGTPLVVSPLPTRKSGEAVQEKVTNDFLFGDDPLGQKCPLGAHIRRANPRDTGGRNNVRHHRILRRGIAYGGPLLKDDEPVGAEKKGLLFVAACARIDVQFEVIQADWLNGGEFLGQAGLGRCPLTGTSESGAGSIFLEPGAAAPLTGLPAFVTMRGGDYFFAPGVKAVKAMAGGKTFAPDDPAAASFMGQAVTPTLFGKERLREYVGRILKGESVIRVGPRRASAVPSTPSEATAFVGRYEDVKAVLNNERREGEKDQPPTFSVSPYREAGIRLSRGGEFPVGFDAGDEGHTHRIGLLGAAWNLLGEVESKDLRLRGIVDAQLQATLRRVADVRRIDLMDDFASAAAYSVVEELFGVPGPTWLTEMAVALPFARQHVASVPPDWLGTIKGERPANPGRVTMQVWMGLVVNDLLGNVQNRREAQAVSRQAAGEALSYFDEVILVTRAKLAAPRKNGDPKPPQTLVEAFVMMAADPQIGAQYSAVAKQLGRPWQEAYFRDVTVILLETIGSVISIVPLTFTSVMTSLLTHRIDLSKVLPMLKRPDVDKLILEAERLNPNLPYRVRSCTHDADISGKAIKKGDFVAALIAAANKDPLAFDKPEQFSLDRKEDDYLTFGVVGSGKYCWGRDRFAMPMLREYLYACARLRGLRPVAGPRGAPQERSGMKTSLPARFTSVSPNDIPRRW